MMALEVLARRIMLAVLAVISILFAGSLIAVQLTQSFTIPTAHSATKRMVTEKDNIWFVEYNTNKIGLFNRTDRIFSEFDIPTKRSHPSDITLGPDGSLWYTQQDANQIGHFNPITRTFKEYDIPTIDSLPFRITTDAKGDVWFTEHYGNRIARFSVASETFTEYEVPTPSSRPAGIAVDASGGVWFLETHGNKLGFLNPEDGSIKESALPELFAVPIDMVFDENGVIWFGGRRGSTLIAFDPTRKAFEVHAIPGGGGIGGLTVNSTGKILFALENSGKIGLFNPVNGEFKIVKAVLEESKPYGIETDDEGNIWFADLKRNVLCRLDGQVLSLVK